MRRHLSLPVAILAICSFAICHVAAAQQWRELGPAPVSWFGGSSGRISAIACSPTDPDRMFAGGADGGVWRTTDGGASWQPVTPFARTSAIGALAIDPVNENVIYVGTGEANYANHSRYGLGLLKSVDGGDTWELLAEETFAGRTFARIAINPDRPSVLYAAIGRAGGFPELAAAKGHPQAEGDVGVFKSEDGGRSWRRLTGLPGVEATDVALDSGDPETIYAGIGRIFGHPDNGVYRSRDGGEAWVRLAGGLPTGDIGRISVGAAPSRPQTLYAMLTQAATPSGGSAGNIGAFRSDDGGNTWRPYGGVDQATYGWYLSVIRVHPDDAEVVFYGGLRMRRYRSPTSGFTVTPPHVDIHAIEFDAAGRLISGDDGGVHRSEDLGQSWISLNDGLGTAQFYAGLSTSPADERIVFGGLQDNGSNLRSDESLAWRTVRGGDGGWTQIDQARPNRMFAESQGTGNLWRSTDGGESWHGAGGVSGRNSFLPPYLIDPINPDRMLYATHRIHESLTGGGGWSVISTDLTKGEGAIRALAIAPSDPNFVYVATNDGNVQVSEDGGRTFRLSLSDQPGWPRVTREIWVSPSDPQTALLAGAHFGVDQVRRTRDAGRTWESFDGDLPDVPVNVVIADERATPPTPPTLYAGADTGVFYSIDDGATWRRYGAGLPTCAVIDLILEPGRDRLVIGTQGRGAWSVRAPAAPCPADCDGDGVLTFFDFLCFQDAFARGDPWADFDPASGRGELDFFDLLAFQNAFAGGC